MGNKAVSWIAILVLGWCLKFAWNVVQVDADEFVESDDYAEWVAEDDAWVAEELAAGSAEQADGWLDRPGHGTFEADPAAMRELIATLQEAGAVDVWMLGIESLGQHRLADVVAAELPEPGPERDALFAMQDAHWGGEGPPDLGQRYLVFSFD